MITLDNIKEILPTLLDTWIPHPDGRLRYPNSKGSRDIWQSVFLERNIMRGMVEIINNLEDVSDMTVLDLGCDAGLVSVILSQKFKKVIALDKDETSIKRTKQTIEIFHNAGYDVSNIEIHTGRFNYTYRINYLYACRHNNFGNDNIDALYKVDAYHKGLDFFNDESIIDELHHLKLLIMTDREDTEKSLDERKSYVDKLRKKFKEFYFELSEFKTVKHNRTSDVYIGRKNETEL